MLDVAEGAAFLCPLPLPEYVQGSSFINCLVVVAPAIEEARERVRRGVRAFADSYAYVPFDVLTIEECLAANLINPLLMMMSRVMVLELNIGRLEGVLEGNTPEERFHSFINRLREPEVVDRLHREHPVLFEQVGTRLDQWAAFSLEFLKHLCDDWDLLRQSLFRIDPGMLQQIDGQAGDTHRNGRSVMIASFTSGAQLVYKPHSLSVDGHFQELLGWLNDRGAQPEFRLLKSLNSGDHGWVEFIAVASCSSAAEVSRFYQRQGSYLAILYALEAADFHCENLIAAGEHPMLVDLEALFHPSFGSLVSNGAEEISGSMLLHSVLGVGLLPTRFWADEEQPGIDLSGLGSAAGQITPRGVPGWERAGTDEMHMIRKRVPMPGSANRPSLNGQEVNVLDYVDAIASGFASMYRLLMEHRSKLIIAINRFSEDEVRVIARATATYGTLLYESFHPDVLRNEADRLAHFSQLRESVAERPALTRLVAAEIGDLLRGDIPLFTTCPSSRDLRTSDGRHIENYFEHTGLELVERRLRQLGEEDLNRQLWIVRASIATLSSEASHENAVNSRPVPVYTNTHTNITSSQLISTACTLGDRLAELAFRRELGTSWLHLATVNERERHVWPLGPDLYDGLSGIILFLAYLGAVSGDPRYSDLAQSALKTLRNQIDENGGFDTTGAFSGWGGIIYLLAHLGTIWSDPSLFAMADGLLERVQEFIAQDTEFDIVDGAAGCILALKSLHSCKPSARTLEIARACGEHLLRKAHRVEQGVGWTGGTKLATPPLTGFAHGNAGIAYALLVLAEMTGEPLFMKTAREGFDYEWSLFCPEHSNWPDLRTDSATGFVTAWCHGAPGIGLSRFCSPRYTDDPLLRKEINVALATTQSAGFGRNHTLCHGDLGNADILLFASEILREPHWRIHADRVVAAVIEDAREIGWKCGNPLGVESPGLMTGLAGIGYALLRFADPMRIPSILALEPPGISR